MVRAPSRSKKPAPAPNLHHCNAGGPTAWRCLYIAPDGKDTNPGTFEAPFATLDGARAAARRFGNHWQGDVVVLIRGGTYYLDKTLVFEPADSGKNGHRLIFQPYGRETVTIAGGRRVGGWSGPLEGGIWWTTDIPPVTFRHLVVNGRRAQRARHPNGNKYLTIAAWDAPADWNNWRDPSAIGPANPGRRLGIRDRAAWFAHALSRKQLGCVEVYALRRAGSAILRVAVVERRKNENGIRYIIPKRPERDRLFGAPVGCWWQEDNLAYHLENSMAFLDEPGDWFLDTTTGTPTLYYKPRRGEALGGDTVVIAPHLETLVRFRGTARRRVHDVVLRGLHFTATTWLRPNDEGFVSLSPGVDYRDDTGGWDTFLHPGAIHLEGTERVRLERNVLHALGGMGIALHDHTRETVVDGNAILEIAGIGIAVDGEGFLGNYDTGELPFPPAGKPRSDGDRITNNRIQRYGLDYWASAGVAAAYPWAMAFAHNEISEGRGHGFALGWYGAWTRCHQLPYPGAQPPLPCDQCLTASGRNCVIGNRIFAVGGLVDDVGGIYVIGQQSPTRSFKDGLLIRGNHVFGMKRPAKWVVQFGSLRAALYLDGDTSFTTVIDNIFEAPVQESDQHHLHGFSIFTNPDTWTSVPPNHLRWSRRGHAKPPGDNVTSTRRKPAVRATAGLSPGYEDVPSLETFEVSRRQVGGKRSRKTVH